MNRFRLRFPSSDVAKYSTRYKIDALNPTIEDEILPRVRNAGYISKPDFLTICRWKTARSQSRCNRNTREFIESVSKVALSASDERLRIEIWTLLHGVDWPTASTLLHWLHNDEYPILDFRALWSLGHAKPSKYDFIFWLDYVGFCRTLARECGVTVRTLDHALWQYSREKQRG